MSQQQESDVYQQEASPRRLPHMLFPEAYVWLVFVSAMDLMFTRLILGLGGREVNPMAEAILEAGGFPGMVIFKFSLVIFVILICEYVGRRRYKLAHGLAWVGVGIGAIPIVAAMGQLVIAFALGGLS